MTSGDFGLGLERPGVLYRTIGSAGPLLQRRLRIASARTCGLMLPGFAAMAATHQRMGRQSGRRASPEGLEPPTSDLEGRCSIQLSYGLCRRPVTAVRRGTGDGMKKVVGAAGFELATYWSQTSCATRLRYAPKNAIVLRRSSGPAGVGPKQ